MEKRDWKLSFRYYLGSVELMEQKLLPRRKVLEQVWRSARQVMFKNDEELISNGDPN